MPVIAVQASVMTGGSPPGIGVSHTATTGRRLAGLLATAVTVDVNP